jgi:hypothetical protein
LPLEVFLKLHYETAAWWETGGFNRLFRKQVYQPNNLCSRVLTSSKDRKMCKSKKE